MSMRPITEVAAELDLGPADLLPFGHHVAKLPLELLSRLGQRHRGQLVLVSAITPTPAGEGKTTVSVGLAQGLRRIGARALAALREPSLGPVFGKKGGGTGGGRARLEPSDRINLHLTGDLHAITAAHNLLAAMVDAALYFGKHDLDARRITWPRALDVNDRALRNLVIGLGGSADGVPRESSFAITAASEVMAILCLAQGIADLKQRLGRITVGLRKDKTRITAAEVGAAGPMAALLYDAVLPNLVQTAEGGPALVHGGPFANIAHGCSSVMATQAALGLADLVITEAGFGFDLGGEKFLHIKCPAAEVWPSVVVLVVTARALRSHGRGDLAAGLDHLDHHVEAAAAFGLRPIIAINVRSDDATEDLKALEAAAAARGLECAQIHCFQDGGAGSEELARLVVAASKRTAALAQAPTPRRLYALTDSIPDKLTAIARTMYGAAAIELGPEARAALPDLASAGDLPICVAKTNLSLTDDPHVIGRPQGHVLHVRALRAATGAGYILALCGHIMTMPGLPAQPAALGIDLAADGSVTGLT